MRQSFRIGLRSAWLIVAVTGQTSRTLAAEPLAAASVNAAHEANTIRDFFPDATLRGSQDFEVRLTTPALYTTYATRESTGAGVADRPDLHSNPDVLVRWVHQYAAVQITASVGATLDRYSQVTEASANTLQGRLKLAWTDGRSDEFVPYASYGATLDYEPDFQRRDDTLHDLAIGFTSGIGFDQAGHSLAYRASTEPGQSSLALDVKVGRRLADPGDFQNTFLAAAADISHNVSPALTVSVAPSLRMRWYESYRGHFRRDGRLGAGLRAAWTPDWLKRIVPRSELGFGVGYYRNTSSMRLMSYQQWELGPTFEFGRKF